MKRRGEIGGGVALAVAALTVAAFALRCPALGRSLWLDEAWRANLALAPSWAAFWNELLGSGGGGIGAPMPPLFALALRAMIVPNPRAELNPLLSVGEQIATMARVHLRLPRHEARRMALDMLRAVQIPDPERRMGAFPHEMSGGMAQRIVIAIALICSPKFIVSDDATSGLDVTVQAQVLELLRRLVLDRGSAMLFITRDIGIAAHFCDRVAVMYDGEILELAPREDFFFRPCHPYTVHAHGGVLPQSSAAPDVVAP